MHEFDKYIVNKLIPSYLITNTRPEKVSSTYETIGSRLARTKEKFERIENSTTDTIKMNISELIEIIESDKTEFFHIRTQKKYQNIKAHNETKLTPEEDDVRKEYL